MRAYTPPATVTCCGKRWHTCKRSWRHTTSSECGNRPSLTLLALARFVRCSMGYTTSYWQEERWSRRVADMLTSYGLCWNPSLGTWDVKWRVCFSSNGYLGNNSIAFLPEHVFNDLDAV